MKRISTFTLAAGLLACALPLASGWSAPVTLHRQDNPQEKQQQPEVKTFTGKISKSGQQFILEDDSMKTSYQLDDQKKAQQFQGKKVRITGTLDAENNLIHVQAIEEAV